MSAFRLMLRLLGPVGLVLLVGGCSARPDEGPPDAGTLAYVGRPVCAECHAEEAAAWTGSDHDLAMAPATAESVLGDFDDAVFSDAGVETRFFRRGDRFLVRTEGRDGQVDTFQVTYTFGVRPLQQYLVAFPDGRVQALTVAWDTDAQRWFSLYPGERIPPGDFVHWTGRGMNWNYMCAGCHSTNLQKNFDLASNTYHTTWSEIDVSCEACHGPGEAHVAWARAWDGDVRDTTRDLGLTVRMKDRVHARQQVDTCAPCHARRRVVAPGFTPGDAFLDHYAVELLDADPLYYPDGQIRDEVFEYGSFLQSKMYHSGVRCTDCHDPHTTRVKLQGNALCTQCHAGPTYDTPAHHFHEAGTPGAACVDCHMPERTYMVVDPRRDHSFKVPRPDLTVELGVPNACSGCHADRSAAWARDQVVAWYGPQRADSAGYAHAIAAGRRRDAGADDALARLVRDAALPAILRASAAALLAAYETPAAQTTLHDALHDAEPLVRLAAVRSFEHRPDDGLHAALSPLLADSLRAVRVEAARILARVAGRTPAGPSDAFERALAEYRQSLDAVSDQPEAHINRAVLHEQLSEYGEAEAAYRTALRLDSAFVPAHTNLAMLYDRQRTVAQQAGRTDAARALYERAEAHLRTALRLAPEAGEMHYTLGLLLAEDTSRLPEAAVHLREAARLSPRQARIQYNAGLAHQHLKQAGTAETFLLAAHRLEPRNPDFLYALSVFYMQQAQWEDALDYTDALLREHPGAPAARQQRSYILAQMQGAGTR